MAHRRTVQIVGAIGGTLPITGTAPTIDMFETDGGVNEKWWRVQSNSGTWSVMTLTDAGGAGATALSITRSGTTVGAIGLNGSTITTTGAYWQLAASANTISLYNSGMLQWSTTGSAGGAAGVTLAADDSSTLALRNGTTAQHLRIYNTYTDASNWEQLQISFGGNIASIFTDKLGSGTYRILRIGAAGTEWQWDTNGYYTPLNDNSVTVGDATHRVSNLFSVIGTFGTNPATTGAIRIGNAQSIVARNSINSADVVLLTLDSSNVLQIGHSNSVTINIDAGSGSLNFANKLSTYNAITTAGQGVTTIYADGNIVGATGATASVATYTVGAADGTFEIAANVNVTTATTHNFTVTCTYTDETNTSRTLTIPFSQLSGTILTNITNVTGAGPYEGVKMTIRAKAATSITIATTGTFTTVVYNVRGNIQQIG